MKNWLIGKDPDSGKDWRWEEKGMTEDERVGWHHQLDGQEFEQAPGVGDGQGGLSCCSPWGHKESDMTELLNWTDDLKYRFIILQFYSSEVQYRSYWAKSSPASRAGFSSGGSRGEFTPLPFPASWGYPHPLAHRCLLHLQCQHVASLWLFLIALSVHSWEKFCF